MKLLKFLAAFGLLSVQRSGHLHAVADCAGCHLPIRRPWIDQVQLTATPVSPVGSTVRISGLRNVTRRRESLPRVRMPMVAKHAACKPIPHIIEFTAAENPSGFEISPTCTRVNRCSGCCNNVFLSCQVKKIVFRELQVRVLSFERPWDKLIPVKVVVEEHESCECECKPQQQCSSKADYKQDLCRCMCRDKREEDACKKQSRIKIWDADNCTCSCREIDVCSEGLEFDHLNCVCKLKDQNKRSRG